MDRHEHINAIKEALAIGLGECSFIEKKLIKYLNEEGNFSDYIVDIFEQKNKLVIFVDNIASDKLQKELVCSGYIPLEHLYTEVKNKDGETTKNNDLNTDEFVGGSSQPVENDAFLEEGVSFEWINNRSEISDLIGNSPNWLLRSGIATMFFVIAVVLLMASIIKYPDKITSKGVITTSQPPIELYSRVTARVEEIIVSTGTHVQAETPILYLDNSANRSDVELVKIWIDRLILNIQNKVLESSLPERLKLGQIQQSYSQLYLKFNEYQQVLKSKSVINQISNIKEEILHTELLTKSLKEEMALYKSNRLLRDKDLNRQKLLYEQGVISEIELENTQIEYSQYEREFGSLEKSEIQNNIRIESLETEVLKLKDQREDNLQTYRFALATLIESVRIEIEKWERDYFIKSEIPGIVEITDEIVEDKLLNPIMLLGYIKPTNEQQMYARLLLEADRLGDLEVGNKCLLKIDAYPYKQYGVVASKLGSVSSIPIRQSDSDKPMYEVKIPLTGDLTSEYGKVLDYLPNMSVNADLITAEKSLVIRLFNNLYDQLQNK